MTLRLVLDQNFPKPPGFALEDVDQTVEAIHVHDHDTSLTASGVPDWLIYLRAAEDQFDGVVTRDWHQMAEPEGLWVLGNLRLVVISWRRPFNDPVTEWGHLLAYMPQIKRRVERQKPRVILLPQPQLGKDNEVNPRDALGEYAFEQRRAVAEIRQEAEAGVLDYLQRVKLARLSELMRRDS